jgi:hypothetical protein
MSIFTVVDKPDLSPQGKHTYFLQELAEKLNTLEYDRALKTHFTSLEEARSVGFAIRAMQFNKRVTPLLHLNGHRVRHTVKRISSGGDILIWLE